MPFWIKYKTQTKFKVYTFDLHQLFACNQERITLKSKATQIISLNVLRLKLNHHGKKNKSLYPSNQLYSTYGIPQREPMILDPQLY